MRKILALLISSLAFLNPITVLPASASSCLSKADQAAMTGSNFDFLYMENCYKAIGLSSTAANCNSILNSALRLYILDWDKDAFRRVMEYDSCRENISTQPKPEPKPSETSNTPKVPSIVIPVVPGKPVTPKNVKCTVAPSASGWKVAYFTDWTLNPLVQLRTSEPFYFIGKLGFLSLEFTFNGKSKSAPKFFRVEVQTSSTKGKWTAWRYLTGGNLEDLSYGKWVEVVNVTEGVNVNPAGVKGVRVRVQLSNDCGKTKWIELTSRAGMALWNPALGVPSYVSCLGGYMAYDDGTPKIEVLGFGNCTDYKKYPIPD